MIQTSLFNSDAGATFSADEVYRYHLYRRWAVGRSCLWVMLNPSTADAHHNDPTVERCEHRARTWGFPAVEVVNLFAFRSTDPGALQYHPDPVGPDNDLAIVKAAEGAGRIICAWGAYGYHRGRSAQVRALLANFELHVLRVTKDGEPGHPLYLPYALEPVLWEATR